MIKVFVVGLGLLLSTGVVSAQSKRAPRRKPPASAPASPGARDRQPAASPSTPEATPPAGAPTGPSPAQPAQAPLPASPAAGNPARSPEPAGAGGANRTKPTPLKTDEKAGPNEKLQQSSGDYKTASKVDQDCALASFHKGNDQLNDALFPQAVTSYQQALRCWNHPAVHYNLALALINLDQPIDVFDHLNAAIQYGAGPIGQDKFDHAKEYLKLVGGQLADIEVSCDKAGAKVSVDGKEVFVAPGRFKAKVRVGKHTFYGEKAGYNARVTAPFIGPGETFRIELKLYTAEELTDHRRRWSPTWMPYTVIGAGVLVGLVGGAFELSARSSYQDFDSAVAKCNTTTAGCAATTPGLLDKRDSGDTKRMIGYVGYGIAGAAIATGAVLAWLNRSQAFQISPEEFESKRQAAPPVAVAPIVSPELTGAMVQGHF